MSQNLFVVKVTNSVSNYTASVVPSRTCGKKKSQHK